MGVLTQAEVTTLVAVTIAAVIVTAVAWCWARPRPLSHDEIVDKVSHTHFIPYFYFYFLLVRTTESRTGRLRAACAARSERAVCREDAAARSRGVAGLPEAVRGLGRSRRPGNCGQNSAIRGSRGP